MIVRSLLGPPMSGGSPGRVPREDMPAAFTVPATEWQRPPRPSKHESDAKKRERDDNTPLAVKMGLAKSVIRF